MIASACSRSATTEAAFWRERAERLAAENARLAAQNTTLAGTVAAQREQLAALKQRVVTLSRMRCGQPYQLFGEDVSEEVSWRVRVWRVVHRRRKYRRCCRCPVPAVVTAPGPAKLIGKGLFTAEFCVNLLIAKY